MTDKRVLTQEEAARAEILGRFHSNRWLAHSVLFAHRHKEVSPDFHPEIVSAFHGKHPRELVKAFRGAAKSTLAEEAMLIMGGFLEFQYGIIVGNTYAKACQRLTAIKREVDNNKLLLNVFGDLRGGTWNEGKVQFSSGLVLQAFSRGQSIRGVKEVNRPDFVLIDDLEDEESTRDKDAIAATMAWLLRELIPALDHASKTPIRMLGTPLAPNCVLEQLEADEAWNAHTYPIRYETEQGMQSAWPGKFSLEEISRMEAEATRLHNHKSFSQEYLCVSESSSERVFKEEDFRYEPRIRTWETTFVVVDPARTANRSSATTGYTVHSWIGSRLVVWEAKGEFHKPDEIISEMFRLDEIYRPAFVAIEEDGLNEWLLQPIRQRQLDMGRMLPLRAVKAPKGKLSFIDGLQPYFAAHDVIFAGAPAQFSNATAQFMSYPKGRIDVPNALAYALRLRAGEPVYSDFGMANIFPGEDYITTRGVPLQLAINADGNRVTAVLLQSAMGTTRVIADWVYEGTPEERLRDIVTNARLYGASVRVVAGPAHFNRFHNYGLIQAAARVPIEIVPGAPIDGGRAEITTLLRRQIRGMPALMISSEARWTLNAFSAGYARRVQDGNILAREPEIGVYRTLMEGLESLIGFGYMAPDEQRAGLNYREGRDGQPYVSILRGK